MKAACVYLVLAIMSLGMGAACNKGDDTTQTTVTTEPTGAAPSVADRAQVLRTAFEADTNCQLLVACCGSLEGTPWQANLAPYCGQVPVLQNFEEEVRNNIDVDMQTNMCRNSVTNIQQSGNSANPIPDACRSAQ